MSCDGAGEFFAGLGASPDTRRLVQTQYGPAVERTEKTPSSRRSLPLVSRLKSTLHFSYDSINAVWYLATVSMAFGPSIVASEPASQTLRLDPLFLYMHMLTHYQQ